MLGFPSTQVNANQETGQNRLLLGPIEANWRVIQPKCGPFRLVFGFCVAAIRVNLKIFESVLLRFGRVRKLRVSSFSFRVCEVPWIQPES